MHVERMTNISLDLLRATFRYDHRHPSQIRGGQAAWTTYNPATVAFAQEDLNFLNPGDRWQIKLFVAHMPADIVWVQATEEDARAACQDNEEARHSLSVLPTQLPELSGARP